MLDRLRAQWTATRNAWAALFGAWSLALPSLGDISPVVNTFVVLGVVALTPLALVAASWLRDLRRARSQDLPPTAFAAEVLAAERTRLGDRARYAWDGFEGETGWLGPVRLLWHKSVTRNADDVEVRVGEELLPALVPGAPRTIPDAQPERRRGALSDFGGLLSDEVPYVSVRPVRWELTQAVRDPAAARAALAAMSCYADRRSLPFPGILCTHNVLRTADGWLLLSRRSRRTRYFPGTWSLGFEEQVEVGHGSRDPSLGATVRRGVLEEFGPDLAEAIRTVDLMGLGVEHHWEPDVVVGGVALCLVEVDVALDAVWAQLARPLDAIDQAEHRAWAAMRPRHRSQIDALVRASREAALDWFSPVRVRRRHDLSLDVRHGPGDAQRRPGGWHPTSLPRLLLWSEVAHHRGELD